MRALSNRAAPHHARARFVPLRRCLCSAAANRACGTYGRPAAVFFPLCEDLRTQGLPPATAAHMLRGWSAVLCPPCSFVCACIRHLRLPWRGDAVFCAPSNLWVESRACGAPTRRTRRPSRVARRSGPPAPSAGEALPLGDRPSRDAASSKGLRPASLRCCAALSPMGFPNSGPPPAWDVRARVFRTGTARARTSTCCNYDAT